MRLEGSLDVIFRASLVLFIDIVLAKRTNLVFSFKDRIVSWLQYEDTSYVSAYAEFLTAFVVAFVFVVLCVTAVLPVKQIKRLGLLSLPFILIVSTVCLCVKKMNAYAHDYQPWNWRLVVLGSFPLPILSFLTVYASIYYPCKIFQLYGLFQRTPLLSCLCGIVGAFNVTVPTFFYYSKAKEASDIHSHYLKSSAMSTSPSVCSYFLLLGGRFSDLDHSVALRYSECLRTKASSQILMDQHFIYHPEVLAALLFISICSLYTYLGVFSHLCKALETQLMLLTAEPINYLSESWSRLEVPSVFFCFWLIKLASVVILGPSYWPIDARVIELLSRATDDTGKPITHALNFTFLTAYAEESHVTNTLSHWLASRLLTGVFAIGAETWTSVYGAAVCVGLLSGLVVNLLAFCVDPLGENIAQLIQIAEGDPVAANPWVPIEDQLTNNEHIEVTAVELLHNTSWSCVILFVFLAIQYDLPNLPSHQRIFCFAHLLIVMGFTCIYPVESLVKAILLRLGLPGSQSPWLDHLIPLFFCALMVGLSGCVFVYFPVWLSYLPYTGRSYQFLGGKSSLSEAAGGMGGSSGSISVYTSYAQRLRTYLCGGQLLLDVCCTLFEYGLHQARLRWPLWTGFTPLLTVSRLFNIFVNYIISLLSVLVILWLIIYESFGVCRVFILIVHVFFVLYPATCRGFVWIRTQFLLRGSMRSIPSPTQEQLDDYADGCAICYEEMSVGDAKRTRCGHMYHTRCLIRWVRRRPICPMCNTDLFTT